MLLIISCQKENLSESEIKETSTSNEIKHSIISIEDVQKNKKVISSLNKFKKLTPNKSSSKSNEKFKIVENSIKFIQKGDYHSYTFLISNNSASNNIQNLLLSLQNDGSYKSLLITYHLSTEEMRDYSLGGKVNFSTKTTIRPIDLKAEFFNPNIFNKSIECFEYVVTESLSTGWDFLKLEIVPCESSTSGGGGFDDGGGFGDDPDPPVPPAGGTGGGGSGGGSGAGTGETIVGCTTDADGNCIGDITSPLVIYETLVTVGDKLGIYNDSSDLGQWLYTQATNYEIVSLNNFLAENTDNPEAEAFAIEAATAFMYDGEVDLNAHLINNPGLHDFIKSRMSLNESALFESISTVQKAGYLRAATEAYIYAEAFYPQPVRNRKGDAVKHTLWNALSTNYIGASLTKQLTDAHEEIDYDPDYSNHFKETDMDLFNNAKGRELATQYGSFIFQLVENALENGNLRYLNNLVFLDGFYNATDGSNLIPTNQ